MPTPDAERAMLRPVCRSARNAETTMDPARRSTRKVLDVPAPLPQPSLQDAITSINGMSTEADFQSAKERSDVAYDVEKRRKQGELRAKLKLKGAEIVKKKVDNNASAVATRKRHDEMIRQLALALRRREAESKVVMSALLAAYDDLGRLRANTPVYTQAPVMTYGQASQPAVFLGQGTGEMTPSLLGRPDGSLSAASVAHMPSTPKPERDIASPGYPVVFPFQEGTEKSLLGGPGFENLDRRAVLVAGRQGEILVGSGPPVRSEYSRRTAGPPNVVTQEMGNHPSMMPDSQVTDSVRSNGEEVSSRDYNFGSGYIEAPGLMPEFTTGASRTPF